MKYTSAEAGKLVKKLEEQVKDILKQEEKSAIFHVASGEDVESLRPDYDFLTTQQEIDTLRSQIRMVKHAINVFNTTHELPGFEGLTIDQALVYIPQLTARRTVLHDMAMHLPKERVDDAGYGYGERKNFIDYEVTNYDRAEVRKAFDRVSETLVQLQLALDSVNSTETMEIDIDNV